MNAPALNLATVTAPTPGGPNAASASAVVASPLAGFEALIAALFPQPATAAQPTVTAPKSTAATAGEPTDDAAPTFEDSASLATPVAGDANTALAASLIVAQVVVADPANPTIAANPANPAPASTRGRSPGGVLPPAGAGLLSLDPQAMPQAAPGPDEAAPEAAQHLGRTSSAGSPVAPARPFASAATGWAPPAASATAQAATAPVVAVELQPQDSIPAALAAADSTLAPPQAAIIAAGVPARPEPAQPAPPRPARNERKGAPADAAPGATQTAKLADRPAPAATAASDVGAAKTTIDSDPSAIAEPDATPDQPDGLAQSETRAAQQAAAPTTPGSHGVRGSPETVANLAAQIIKKLEGQSTRFDLELNPAGLGKVDVRLEIGAHGALTAAMTFDNPQAASELKARAAELQRALEQAGFNLSGGLTFDVARDGGRQHQQAWQDQPESRGGGSQRGDAFRAALDAADAADAAGTGALRLRRGVTAGLDVRI